MLSTQLWAGNLPPVTYNKSTDTISINAQNTSYKEILADIATLSGIEIQMHPKAEHSLSITLSDLPLETALKELSHEISYAFFYDKKTVLNPKESANGSVEFILTGMHVLPKGEFSNDMLRPILAPSGEAFIREKNRHSASSQRAEMFNHAQQRWEARLQKMPPETREKLLTKAQAKREKIEQRHEKRTLRKEKSEERRKARKEQREEELEALKINDPERYELKMQRREEHRLERLE